MEEQLIDLIPSLGFPIVVTVYLLWERGRVTKELTKAIIDLHVLIKARLK